MKLNRVVSFILAAIVVLGCIGCSGRSGKTDGKSLTLWAEPSTVKIMQNDKGEAKKSAKEKNVLQVSMAKNETEGVQLMMYAKKNIADYTVTISDLGSGKNVISAEQIEVYMLKYQLIESVLQTTPNEAYPIGSYVPDPMLPMDTAIEYNENVVEKGNNQAIYFDITTTKDTKPGTYEGVVTVKVEKETYKVPMEVKVYDVELPDTPGLKTSFTYYTRDTFSSAELDSSDEMTATYVETLMKYNMGSQLPFEGEGGIEKYLELLQKYYDYPGFTAYRLYYDPSGAFYKGKECTYNAPLLKEYIRAIAELSVEQQKNYLEKAYCWFYTVADEPVSESDFNMAKDALDIYRDILSDCDAELRYQYMGTENYEYYVTEISDDLIGLPNLLAGSLFVDELDIYDLQELTMVPQIDNLHTEANRKLAVKNREDKQLWTYTCNFPVYPYPTSHVDDYNLGYRLTSWMCCDYDWDGFLQWRSVETRINDPRGGELAADPWGVANTNSGRPGEGIYFYPGAKYGLKEPCPSIRAVIYRDGTEDYEVLKAVGAIYEEYGLDASYALDDIYSQVYTGVIPITDSYVFEDVRTQLFALINDLKSDVGLLYEKVEVGFSSADIYLRTTNAEAELTVDGKSVKADENGTYHVTVDLTKQAECKIKVVCGKEEKEYTRRLADGVLGSICGFEKEEKLQDYVLVSGKGSEAVYNQASEYVMDGMNSLHATLNEQAEDIIPYFAIEKSSKLIGGSWKDISSMKFYVYNASEEEVSMEATYYTTAETLIDTYQLPVGEWTLIEIQMPSGLDDMDSIQEFDFNFKKGSKVELYMDNFATITKGEK